MGPGRAAHGQRTALPAARLGGALVCVGSTMTFVFGATVPSYSNGQPMAVLLPSVVAFVFGLWCIAMGARTHRYVVYAIPSAAALAMSGSLWVTDTALESSELLFVWCVLFASYFMPTAPAAANTVFVAASYAVVVIGRRGLSVGLPPAIELAATAAVACILVLRLRRQVESSLDDALEQARTDPLTRVLNRRGFSEALAVEIARARRAGEPLSALMIDLDHFKRLNDTHGHAAGDRTLQQVAQVLRTQLRGIDAVARLGGEEFCVLLPSCPADDAAGRADALCVAVAQPASGALGVTVSIGVATLQDADRDGGALLHAADSALYEAKAAGRNRSAVAAPFIKR